MFISISKRNGICGAGVMLAAISLLAGCSKQEPTPASAAAAPAAAPAPVAAPAPAATPQWLASTQGDYPGITVAVQELKRGPYALKLKLVVINQSQENFDSDNIGSLDSGGYYSIGAAHLIDMTNRKKYFVVRDHDGNCLCSRGDPSLPRINARSQFVLWAEYPLPPDDVQKISVEVPHFPPMEDVPISR